MRAIVIGAVFLALFVLGMWTVWLQTETLRIGYRMEELRRSMVANERANVILGIEIASLKTPGSLLDREGFALHGQDTVIPMANVVWTAPLRDADEVRLAVRDDEETKEISR